VLPTNVTVGVAGVSAGVYDITFGGLAGANTDVGDIVADAAGLTGALDNGKLLGTANFDASLYNGSGIIVLTTRDGAASVTIATRDEGGSGAGVTTLTQGSASPATNEVQELLIRAGGGTYTLFLDRNGNGAVDAGELTGAVAYNALAAALEAALEALGGGLDVTVTARTVAGGMLYDVAFGGSLAATNVAQLLVDGTSLTARNEVQEITVSGADTGSTYDLGLTEASTPASPRPRRSRRP
jgi:hypothetical protein